MAGNEVNPQVPFVEGTPYVFWSREIQQPRPNESKAIALESAGKSVSGLAAGINDAYKTGVRNDVYARGDAFMNQEIDNLYQEYDKAQNTPQEVKNLPYALNILDEARSNGKLSPTDHEARLNVLAKDLRSKYPGYRPEVDEYLRASTGRGSTANQLWESLRGDIDASATARKESRSKVENELWSLVKEGYKPAAGMLQQYQAGKLDDIGAAKGIADANSYKYNSAVMKAQREAREDDRKGASESASQALQYRTHHIMQSYMDTMMFSVTGGKPETLTQLSSDVAEGRIQLKAEDAIRLKQVLNSLRAKMFEEIRSESYQTDKNGRSEASDLGSDKDWNEKVESGLKAWDVWSDMILNNKDLSAASAVPLIVKARKDDFENSAQSDPRYGKTLIGLETTSKTLGPLATNPAINPALQDPNLIPAIKSMLIGNGISILAPPPPIQFGTKDQFKAMVSQAEEKKVPPSYYNHLLDVIGLAGNHKLAASGVENIANSVFNVDNNGVVGMFDKKKVVDNFGNTSASKVFDQLTMPKITHQVFKLGQEKPQIWKNYVAWSENEWQSLYQEDLSNLDKLSEHDFIKFKYDNENHKLTLDTSSAATDKNMSKETLRNRGIIVGQANMILNRINAGVHNMQHIYENDGQDVDVQTMRLLHAAGVSPQNIVGKILNSMESSYDSVGPGDE